MTYSGVQSMRDDPQLLSRRLATYVTRWSAKELSDAVGCDVRTAENIKRGHWPVARHWIGLLETFGRDITDAVFHPDEATARLEREIRDLQRQLAATRRAADAASRTAARLGAARNRPQDRTSADLTPEP